jgi:hypothetical protein
MLKKVPYLHEEQIERNANALLAEYEQVCGVAITCQVPIDDIVEKHLKLGIEFDDMHRLLNCPRSHFGCDILGAIFFNERRIVIDESLDPEENPKMEGRYHFTAAHEGGGHWRLHRHLLITDAAQDSMFNEPPTSIVCRSSQAKDRIEWQADFYASCLLMPRKLVLSVWNEMFPDRRPRVLEPRVPVNHPYVDVPRPERIPGCEFEQGLETLEDFSKPLAEKFRVSPIAMRIRLEKLGLLLQEVPRQRTPGAGQFF